MKTRKARLRRAITAVADVCRRHRHLSVKEQHAALTRRIVGHGNYFGVNGNFRATSPDADAGAIAREVASKLELNNARSRARAALIDELLKLSESVAVLVPSHEELARPVASSAWLNGLNVSLATSQPSSRVDQLLRALAKFAVAMTLDYAGDYESNRDPAANTSTTQRASGSRWIGSTTPSR